MVYQHTHVKLTKFLSNVKILKYALKRGDSHLAAKVNFNVLENSAVALCQEVKRVKDYFLSFGIEFRVTGSGSALYAFRPDNFDCSVLKRNLPKHWQLFELSTF
jgi:4-diphosphocytidyl-2C-methyl-D-erythritol kinase